MQLAKLDAASRDAAAEEVSVSVQTVASGAEQIGMSVSELAELSANLRSRVAVFQY